jgi:inhibitor of cysteine peptidase
MLVIDETKNNCAIEISVGDSFRVQLSENPTTGYRWNLQADGAPALRMAQDSFEAPGNAPGGGGLRYWNFSADHPGSTELRMELRRSWQPQPVNSFAVTVSVKTR